MFENSHLRVPGSFLAIALVASVAPTVSGCSDRDSVPAGPPTCEAELPASFEALDTASVYIQVEDALDRSRVETEMVELAGDLWPHAELSLGAPPKEESSALHLWIGSSQEAAALTGQDESTQGYALERVEREGRPTLVAYAADPSVVASAGYAMMEELGVRFFHPEETLVPAYDAVSVPTTLAVERAPAFDVRGVQLHLLHPTEYYRAFNEVGPERLDQAKRVIDWLVHTGQNHVQWFLVNDPPSGWNDHARQIVEYAHGRGVTAGAVVQLWGGASLQNAVALVEDEENAKAEIEASLDEVLTIPFDIVELGLGEFLASDPDELIQWLNWGVEHLAASHPSVPLSVVNHVGNYPELWLEYEDAEVFFYHLPRFADPRLINNVHTVFFFDLYRDWGGYGHEDFSLHREFLMEELGNRPLRYLPESAYWVSADVDVPIFLSNYMYARWLDIHRLHEDTTLTGRPALDGHVMFTSGHEWGYWMADYLSARAMWNPTGSFEEHLGHITQSFGTCQGAVGEALSAAVALQNQYLFDERLVGYLSGEDFHDDIGSAAGFVTTPTRVPFHVVASYEPSELDAFERDVVDRLHGYVERSQALEAPLAEACLRPAAPLDNWCTEIVDGLEVTRLRAQHAERLYRGVVAYARGDAAALSHIDEAATARRLAAEVIARRERRYRFPIEELVEPFDNQTIYNYGYLRQAHTQCYWQRQEKQASRLIESGVEAPLAALPNCLD